MFVGSCGREEASDDYAAYLKERAAASFSQSDSGHISGHVSMEREREREEGGTRTPKPVLAEEDEEFLEDSLRRVHHQHYTPHH